MKKKPKQYFAQNNILDPFHHKAKYFEDFEEAKKWIHEQNGGTIKQRNKRWQVIFELPIIPETTQ